MYRLYLRTKESTHMMFYMNKNYVSHSIKIKSGHAHGYTSCYLGRD